MTNENFRKRVDEILEQVHGMKPIPEPVDLLPKLVPGQVNNDYTRVPKDGMFSVRGLWEVWKDGEFIAHYDNKGEAWRSYWS